ncbi:hypothetical protein SAMN05880501_11568 [Ureibacillus xyleni]|uniref:Uncharacterized protein n=1 Tax=Ureibacillus xyleni TaxID=614648 RepID=A0A285TL81_9BACL|nr:hypothetical protein [Ureibacillus xyleni]SOC23393.1 hypothetical protein SAMN05880501_11568 [Ureibacillus xyleni]
MNKHCNCHTHVHSFSCCNSHDYILPEETIQLLNEFLKSAIEKLKSFESPKKDSNEKKESHDKKEHPEVCKCMCSTASANNKKNAKPEISLLDLLPLLQNPGLLNLNAHHTPPKEELLESSSSSSSSSNFFKEDESNHYPKFKHKRPRGPHKGDSSSF